MCCLCVTAKVVVIVSSMGITRVVRKQIRKAVLRRTMRNVVETELVELAALNHAGKEEGRTTVERETESWPPRVEVEVNLIDALPGDLLVVMARVNDTDVPVLIDTGAATTVASIDLAPELGIETVEDDWMNLTGIAGQAVDIIGSKVVKLGIGTHECSTRLYFATKGPSRGSKYDIILGCDTLRLLPALSVDLARCQLKLGKEVIPVGDPRTSFPVNAALRVLNSVVLKPETETKIDLYMGPIPLDVDTVYMAEELSPKLRDKCLAMAPAVFPPDESGRVSVFLSNPTREHVTLHEDTLLSEAVSVSEDETGLSVFEAGLEVNAIQECEIVDRVKAVLEQVNLENADITGDQKERLMALIAEYNDCFSANKFDLGSSTIMAPTITTKTEEPVRGRPIRVPYKAQEELRKHIDTMLKAGLLDGSMRFCVDYRKLNEVCISDNFPLPTTETVFQRVAGCHYFSTLDLASGFWQIPLDEESSYKTAITTPEGTYRMTHLPFGLKSATSIFARIMSQVLEGVPDTTTYVDDILVSTKTDNFQKHLAALEAVFKRMRCFNLKMSPKKCIFARREVEFLGHVIRRDSYKPSCAGLEKIKEFPSPRTLKEVRRFVGMCSFFRRFIADFSKFSEPLTKLTKKENKFSWGEEQEKAFQRLKGKLLNEPLLSFPDYNKPFHLFTDASQVAMAGVLMQRDEEVKAYRAVSYCSRTMSETERRLPAVHAELGAIVHALRAFRGYIYGAKLIIHTDHSPLTFLMKQSETNPKLARWLLEIATYDVHFTHVKGAKNTVADCLSRLETENLDPKTLEELRDKIEVPYCLVMEASRPRLILAAEPVARFPVRRGAEDSDINTREEQLRDAEVGPILRHLEGGQIPRSLSPNEREAFVKNAARFTRLDNGCLYLRVDAARRFSGGLYPLVVPTSMKQLVFEFFHASHFAGCHMGLKKSLDKARRYYWDGMHGDFAKWVKECVPCQMRRLPKPRFREPMTVSRNTAVWRKVGLDLSGPFVLTENENRYILNVICWFSKFLVSVPLPDARGLTIAKALMEHVVLIHGCPLQIHTDNAKSFTSDFWKEFTKLLGLVHTTSVPYRSQGNALTERSFQIVQNALAKTISDGQRDWDRLLPYVTFAYNTQVHDSTNERPFYMVHGRDPVFSVDLILDPRTKEFGGDEDTDDFRAELITNLRFAWNLALEEAKLASRRQKLQYDKHARAQELKIGDRVFLKNFKTKPGLSRKLDLPWRRQFRVVELSPPHARIVSVFAPHTPSRKIHLDQIKLCVLAGGPPLTAQVIPPEVEENLAQAGAIMTHNEPEVPEQEPVPEPEMGDAEGHQGFCRVDPRDLGGYTEAHEPEAVFDMPEEFRVELEGGHNVFQNDQHLEQEAPSEDGSHHGSYHDGHLEREAPSVVGDQQENPSGYDGTEGDVENVEPFQQPLVVTRSGRTIKTPKRFAMS